MLIDEAHHAVPGSVYERILAAIEQAAGAEPVTVIGLSATPYRTDERSMLSLLPVCAFAHHHWCYYGKRYRKKHFLCGNADTAVLYILIASFKRK